MFSTYLSAVLGASEERGDQSDPTGANRSNGGTENGCESLIHEA